MCYMIYHFQYREQRPICLNFNSILSTMLKTWFSQCKFRVCYRTLSFYNRSSICKAFNWWVNHNRVQVELCSLSELWSKFSITKIDQFCSKCMCLHEAWNPNFIPPLFTEEPCKEKIRFWQQHFCTIYFIVTVYCLPVYHLPSILFLDDTQYDCPLLLPQMPKYTVSCLTSHSNALGFNWRIVIHYYTG